jgi:hypothetical protein
MIVQEESDHAQEGPDLAIAQSPGKDEGDTRMAPRRSTILRLVAAGAVFSGLMSSAPVSRADDLPPALTGYQISIGDAQPTFAVAAVDGADATSTTVGGGNEGGDGSGGDATAGDSIGGPAVAGNAQAGNAQAGTVTGGATSAKPVGQGQSQVGQPGTPGTSAVAEVGEEEDIVFGAPGINGLDGAAATGGVGYTGSDATGGPTRGGNATGGRATGGNAL